MHKWDEMAFPYEFKSMKEWQEIFRQKGLETLYAHHIGFPDKGFHKDHFFAQIMEKIKKAITQKIIYTVTFIVIFACTDLSYGNRLLNINYQLRPPLITSKKSRKLQYNEDKKLLSRIKTKLEDTLSYHIAIHIYGSLMRATNRIEVAKSFYILDKLSEIQLDENGRVVIFEFLMQTVNPEEISESFCQLIPELVEAGVKNYEMWQILKYLTHTVNPKEKIYELIKRKADFLKFFTVFKKEGLSDTTIIHIFLLFCENHVDYEKYFSTEELATILYRDGTPPHRNVTMALFTPYFSNPLLLKTRYLLITNRYDMLDDLIRQHDIKPEMIIQALLLNYQKDIIYQVMNFIQRYRYENRGNVLSTMIVRPGTIDIRQNIYVTTLKDQLIKFNIRLSDEAFELLLKKNGYRIYEGLILPIVFDDILSVYRGSAEYDYIGARYLTHDIYLAIKEAESLLKKGKKDNRYAYGSDALHEFDLGLLLFEEMRDRSGDENATLSFHYGPSDDPEDPDYDPYPYIEGFYLSEYTRKRTILLKDSTMTSFVTNLLHWQLNERVAKQKIYKALQQIKNGELDSKRLIDVIETIEQQLNMLKTDCSLKSEYFEAVYGYIDKQFFSKLQNRYVPYSNNTNTLDVLLKEAMRTVYVVNVRATNKQPEERVRHLWLTLNKTLFDYLKNEEDIRKDTFDAVDIEPIDDSFKPTYLIDFLRAISHPHDI